MSKYPQNQEKKQKKKGGTLRKIDVGIGIVKTLFSIALSLLGIVAFGSLGYAFFKGFEALRDLFV